MRFPRRPVNPAFRRAVLADPRGICRLAGLAGWPTYTQFSVLLHARTTRCSPLVVARFQKIADLIGFTGDVFKERQP